MTFEGKEEKKKSEQQGEKASESIPFVHNIMELTVEREHFKERSRVRTHHIFLSFWSLRGKRKEKVDSKGKQVNVFHLSKY